MSDTESRRGSSIRSSTYQARNESPELVHLGVGATSSLFPISCLFGAFTAITLIFVIFSMDLNFVDALYFYIVTMSSVGYGDYSPETVGDRSFIAIMIILGILISSLMFGILYDLIENLDDEAASDKIRNKQYDDDGDQSKFNGNTNTSVSMTSDDKIKRKESDTNYSIIFDFLKFGIIKCKNAYLIVHKKIQLWALKQTNVEEEAFVEEDDIRQVMTSRAETENRLSEELQYSLKRKVVKMIVNTLIVLIVFLVILLSGSFIIGEMEDWPYHDALYWSLITLTTIGYGDLSPITSAGKLFSIFYIMFGCFLFGVTVSMLAYIPLIYRRRTAELVVLQQFAGDLTEDVIKAMIHSDFYNEFENMRTEDGCVHKGEFVVMLLHMIKKVSSKDITMAAKVFEGLDIMGRGKISIRELEADMEQGMTAEAVYRRKSQEQSDLNQRMLEIQLQLRQEEREKMDKETQLKSYGIEEMEMATINSNNNPSNDDYSIDDGEGSSSSKFNMNEPFSIDTVDARGVSIGNHHYSPKKNHDKTRRGTAQTMVPFFGSVDMDESGSDSNDYDAFDDDASDDSYGNNINGGKDAKEFDIKMVDDEPSLSRFISTKPTLLKTDSTRSNVSRSGRKSTEIEGLPSLSVDFSSSSTTNPLNKNGTVNSDSPNSDKPITSHGKDNKPGTTIARIRSADSTPVSARKSAVSLKGGPATSSKPPLYTRGSTTSHLTNNKSHRIDKDDTEDDDGFTDVSTHSFGPPSSSTVAVTRTATDTDKKYYNSGNNTTDSNTTDSSGLLKGMKSEKASGLPLTSSQLEPLPSAPPMVKMSDAPPPPPPPPTTASSINSKSEPKFNSPPRSVKALTNSFNNNNSNDNSRSSSNISSSPVSESPFKFQNSLLDAFARKKSITDSSVINDDGKAASALPKALLSRRASLNGRRASTTSGITGNNNTNNTTTSISNKNSSNANEDDIATGKPMKMLSTVGEDDEQAEFGSYLRDSYNDGLVGRSDSSRSLTSTTSQRHHESDNSDDDDLGDDGFEDATSAIQSASLSLSVAVKNPLSQHKSRRLPRK